MWGKKTGISLENKYKLPMPEVIKMIKDAGFDALSPVWTPDTDIDAICQRALECGLELQSLHAPFDRADLLWKKDHPETADVMAQYKTCVDLCGKYSIPVLVIHVWIGFEYTFEPTDEGFANFDEIVGYCEKKNVKAAFENTEGEEYLFALMDRYQGRDSVGFCWDSGHEMCYNRSQDLLDKYGDRMIMIHLNDNLGISRADGGIFWTDDVHLLPYDGAADWDYNLDRLRKARPIDTLNLEIRTRSKPDRHENDAYYDMPLEQFFALAYGRACRIAYRLTRVGR